MQYLGDLERDQNLHKTAHRSLDDALQEIAKHFGQAVTEDDYTYITTPDPEDDRILVLENDPTNGVKAVWHFSGWHWDPDCSDWPGGPLPQGTLPGHDKSLYALAMDDY